MNLDEVKRLVKIGECDTIEFKRKIAHPEKVVKEVVAFANSHGGHLIVGVEDDGKIPGLDNPDEHEFALNKSIAELCTPIPEFCLYRIPLSKKKTVLCYHVKESSKKPCSAKESVDDEYGTAYVRVADKTIRASRELKQILKRGGSNRSYKFQYGDKEGILMKKLEEAGQITLNSFAESAGVSRKVASSTLVLLVLAGVLEIIPHEKQDIFKLKNF